VDSTLSRDGSLLPCPFCGSDPIVLHDVHQLGDCVIQCSACCSGPPMVSEYRAEQNEAKAISQWNRRSGYAANYVARIAVMEEAMFSVMGKLKKTALSADMPIDTDKEIRAALRELAQALDVGESGSPVGSAVR